VDEYVVYFTDNFKKVDLNKDGKVTKDEMEKYCKERASKRKDVKKILSKVL
jgi:Ca2+-binding EF-hand superfamily protein